MIGLSLSHLPMGSIFTVSHPAALKGDSYDDDTTSLLSKVVSRRQKHLGSTLLAALELLFIGVAAQLTFLNLEISKLPFKVGVGKTADLLSYSCLNMALCKPILKLMHAKMCSYTTYIMRIKARCALFSHVYFLDLLTASFFLFFGGVK